MKLAWRMIEHNDKLCIQVFGSKYACKKILSSLPSLIIVKLLPFGGELLSFAPTMKLISL